MIRHTVRTVRSRTGCLANRMRPLSQRKPKSRKLLNLPRL